MRSGGDIGTVTVARGAIPRRCWCCALCRRTLQRADSKFRQEVRLDRTSLHVHVVCGHGCKCVRRMKSTRPDGRQLLAATQQEVRTLAPHRLAERKQAREDNQSINQSINQSKVICNARSVVHRA